MSRQCTFINEDPSEVLWMALARNHKKCSSEPLNSGEDCQHRTFEPHNQWVTGSDWLQRLVQWLDSIQWIPIDWGLWIKAFDARSFEAAKLKSITSDRIIWADAESCNGRIRQLFNFEFETWKFQVGVFLNKSKNAVPTVYNTLGIITFGLGRDPNRQSCWVINEILKW